MNQLCLVIKLRKRKNDLNLDNPEILADVSSAGRLNEKSQDVSVIDLQFFITAISRFKLRFAKHV